MFCSSLIVEGDQNSEQNIKIEHFTEMEYIKKKYGTKIVVWHNGKMIVDVFFKRARMVMAIFRLF